MELLFILKLLQMCSSNFDLKETKPYRYTFFSLKSHFSPSQFQSHSSQARTKG